MLEEAAWLHAAGWIRGDFGAGFGAGAAAGFGGGAAAGFDFEVVCKFDFVFGHSYTIDPRKTGTSFGTL